MGKNKSLVADLASAAGSAVARVASVKPKRAAAPKHVKAQTVAEAPLMQLQEEISLVAYLYSEARGFQGGSPEEDWLRAEQEVRRRREL